MKRPDPSAPAAEQIKYARDRARHAASCVENAAIATQLGVAGADTLAFARERLEEASEALAYAAGQVGA